MQQFPENLSCLFLPRLRLMEFTFGTILGAGMAAAMAEERAKEAQKEAERKERQAKNKAWRKKHGNAGRTAAGQSGTVEIRQRGIRQGMSRKNQTKKFRKSPK